MTAAERQAAVPIAPTVAPVRSGGVALTRVATAIRAHWPLLLVLLAFALSAVIVPTFAPVATTDDWAYTRSSQILLQQGRLTIFPVVAATAVFQVVWGALFSLIFGPTFGAVRLSTVVITAIGAVALYGLCQELGVSRLRSALGVASFLFNPLVFVLAFTFMTDAHFAALLIIATWLYVRALGPEGVNGRWLVAGSGVAALAFLARQQGALIVPAVVAFLLLTRRLRLDRASFLRVTLLVALPLLAAGGYYLWLRSGDNAAVQSSFLREMVQEGWSGTWWLTQRLTIVDLMYLGFFTLPIVAALLPHAWRLLDRISRRGWLLFAVWQALLLIGVTALWVSKVRMPYIPQFFGSGGLGPPDVLGSRPILIGPELRSALTVVCLIASLLLALVAARGMSAPPSLSRSRAGLVLSIGLWQVVGVFPPSYHYIGWTAGSLDRYLLPLVPLVIALTLWALRGARISLPLGTTVAVALAIFSVAGTRDYLVFMREVWAMGDEAVAAGVPLDRLDAGSAWDGYYLYEYGRANHVRSRTPKGGPWWVYFYAPATDSTYVVSTKRLPRYFVTEKRSYSSWLLGEPRDIFLLRRWGASWPPWPGVKPILKPAAPGQLAPVTTAAPTAMPVPTVSRSGSFVPGQKGKQADDTA